jgi:hypothetical protein
VAYSTANLRDGRFNGNRMHTYQIRWLADRVILVVDGATIREHRKPARAGDDWPMGKQALPFVRRVRPSIRRSTSRCLPLLTEDGTLGGGRVAGLGGRPRLGETPQGGDARQVAHHLRLRLLVATDVARADTLALSTLAHCTISPRKHAVVV